jgi:non-ribosomal peptide synthetase component F
MRGLPKYFIELWGVTTMGPGVGFDVPIEQRRIQAKCAHPSGAFTEFEKPALERSISERFEQISARYPDRVAITTATHTVTYAELNQRANHLARAILARRGMAKETIALYIEDRSVMVTAMLGVLKTGKLYVPIDPSFPAPRVAFMLDDSEASLAVSDRNNIAALTGLRAQCEILPSPPPTSACPLRQRPSPTSSTPLDRPASPKASCTTIATSCTE